MKLAVKISLAMVALLGVLFAAGGGWMISRNFDHSLQNAVERAAMGHMAQKEALRRELAAAIYDSKNPGYTPDGAVADGRIEQAGKLVDEAAEGGCAIVGSGYAAFYSSLPAGFTKSVMAEIVAADEPCWLLREVAGRTYLVVPSTFAASGHTLTLVSAQEVTGLFAERARQTRTFFGVYVAMVAATALLGALAAAMITRPLHALNMASREIARGDYARRTADGGKRALAARGDEIGGLAQSFDAMAAAVEEKVQTLELSVRQREDFMSAFTHELKTPMTAMMGYAALLQKDGLTPEERKKALGYIHSETKRLEGLSQKLLALFALNGEPPEMGPMALKDVFAGVGRALAPGLGCAVELPEGAHGKVRGDGDLLTDLLVNLVRNAARAGPADGCVRVAVADEGDEVVVSVTDTGCGMPPEVLARLGEPFYRADKARATADGGSGLGLALCARIARLHGTDLAFESDVGKGTAVSFRLRKEAEACS